MKKILTATALILTVFLLPVPAKAQTAQSGKAVTLTRGQVVNENYFAGGDNIVIAGTVNGDAYVAGGNVVVEGTVNGDLLAAGGNISVTGNVTGDVRLAGGQMNISGTVGGNVTAVGGSVDIARASRIGGGVVAAGGNINIAAPIPKGITAGAGQLTLGDTVGGNVLAAVGNLVLTANSSISGNLTYTSAEAANIANDATISGRIQRFEPPVNNRQAQERAAKTARDLSLFFRIIGFLSSLVIGWIILKLFPVYSDQTMRLVDQKPWQSAAYGFLALIIIPVISVILLVSVIGLPLGMILIVLYFIYIYISKLVVSYYVGRRILQNYKGDSQPVFGLAVGLLAYYVVTSLPLVGGLISFAVLIVGLGAILIQKRNFIIDGHKSKYL